MDIGLLTRIAKGDNDAIIEPATSKGISKALATAMKNDGESLKNSMIELL